jgi:transcriptional regulator with XRE-family HTH domain
LKLPRLKEVRELHGWSQAKLAEESDVSRDSISNYETGQREAWPATAKKLADALHVEIADLREPAGELATSGKAEAPPPPGPPETSAQTVEEFERTLAHVLEPVRAEVLREQRATNRAIASEGIPQLSIGDIAEAEAGKRFSDAFSPDERPTAFGEVALGYARLERANVNLEGNYTRAQGLLRERDEKIAQLEAKIARLEQVEEGNTRLREENARLREDIAELRSEAEREAAR